MRKDWWHEHFAKGLPAAQMGGEDGAQGMNHPTHKWLVDYIPEDSFVLDVGCCNAHTYENFKRAGKHINYWGVDQLPGLIDYCMETYPEASFSLSDAADLQDFSDDFFDYVVSRHVHEHQNHYSQHFMEMYRVARKEVIIVGFLSFTGTDFDRLQYGAEGLPHWYNQYSKEGMLRFIDYNMKEADVDIIDDYEETGHPIIRITKP